MKRIRMLAVGVAVTGGMLGFSAGPSSATTVNPACTTIASALKQLDALESLPGLSAAQLARIEAGEARLQSAATALSCP